LIYRLVPSCRRGISYCNETYLLLRTHRCYDSLTVLPCLDDEAPATLHCLLNERAIRVDFELARRWSVPADSLPSRRTSPFLSDLRRSLSLLSTSAATHLQPGPSPLCWFCFSYSTTSNPIFGVASGRPSASNSVPYISKCTI